MEYIKIIDDGYQDHPGWIANDECLVRKFFEEEAKKPIGQRSSSCLISCPCSKCNPATLWRRNV
jgi:hypothetical protein